MPWGPENLGRGLASVSPVPFLQHRKVGVTPCWESEDEPFLTVVDFCFQLFLHNLLTLRAFAEGWSTNDRDN